MSSYLLLFFASFAFAAAEAPQTFTLDGRLYSDSAGTIPLTDTDVDLVFQILDDSQTCVLYQEFRNNFDASATNGFFNFQIGSNLGDAKRSGGEPGLTMKQIYSNVPQAGLNGQLLSNGNPCAHTPSAGDQRHLRVQVTPSSDNVTRVLTPFMTINSVPSAIVAEHAESAATVGAFGPADLLRVDTSAGYVLSQSNLASIFTTSNFSALTTLLAGTSTLYNRPASNGTTVIPTIASPSTPSAGQIWFDSGNLLYHDGGATRTISTGSSTSVAAGAGSAAAPSISFSGDPDTGWYSAGADTLAAATGGVERVRISASGNVGIGSTAPDARLTLGGAQSAPAWTSSGIGIRQNSVTYTDTSSSGTVGFNYVNAFGIPNLAASSATTYTNASAFSLYPPTPGTNVTLTNSTGLTVNASTLTGVTNGYGMQVNAPTGATNNYAATFMGGNVGVGTTAPASTLSVATNGSNILVGSQTATVGLIGFGSTLTNANASLAGDGVLTILNAPTGGPLHFRSGNSPLGTFMTSGALTLDGTNQQIVATTSPFYLDAASANPIIFRNTAGYAERMRIDSSGNVGIGTTAPTAALNLKAGTATAGTAPLKLTAGVNLTTPEAGAIEFDGTSLYYTDSTNTRRTLANTSTGGGDFKADGSVPMTGQFLAITGTPAAPSVAFAGDTNTGLFNVAADYLGFATAGVSRAQISAGSFESFVPLRVSNGSTAASPGYSFGADTNTGVFNPAADTVAVATNGAERMRVDSSGNVGIGTTNPSVPLEVESTLNNGARITSGATSNTAKPVLNLAAKNSGGAGGIGLGSQIVFEIENSANSFRESGNITSVSTDATAASESADLYFSTRLAGTVSEKVRITASGNVGIGTTSPATTFDVNTGNSSNIRMSNGGLYEHYNNEANGYRWSIGRDLGSGGVAGITLKFGNTGTYNSSGTSITSPAISTLAFSTSNSTAVTERMRIDSAGNVGIGTTSPTAALQLKAGTAAAGTAPLKLTAGTNLTTPEAGAIEFDGTSLFYTDSTNTRRTLGVAGAGITALTGDVTASGAGSATATIANDAVTFAKTQNIATQRILGRGTAGSGDVEELTLGSGLTLTGTTLNVTDTTDDDSFATLLGVCGNGFLPYKAGGVWTCIEATSTLANDTLVMRGVSGSFEGNQVTANSLRLNNAGSYVSINTPVAANYALTLPLDDGAANQVLQTDGSGVLSWVTSLVSGGSGLFANGTAVAPSISFTNDTNTGFYNPSNDSNVIATSTNGVERMRVVADGRVGVGTTAPNSKFTVYNSLTASAETNALNAQTVLTGGSTTYSRGAYFGHFIADNGTANYTDVGLGLTGEYYAGLVVNPDGTSSATNWDGYANNVTGTSGYVANTTTGNGVLVMARGMTAAVANSGTGAIRTAYGLHVNGVEATGTDAGQTHNAYGVYIDGVTASGGSTNNAYSIYSNTSAPTYLAGNVGIGTTAPTAKLDVVGNISLTPVNLAHGRLAVLTGGVDYAGYVEWYKPGGNRLGYLGYKDGGLDNLGLNLENSADFIINGGDVGIGTNSPAYKLDVNGAINATAVKINGVDVATSGGAGGGQSSTSSLTFNTDTDNTGSDSGFSFQRNGTEVFSIASSGSVSTGNDLGARFNIGRQDNTSEGGELAFMGAGSFDSWIQDINGNNMRFFTTSTSDNEVQFSNSGTGKMNMQIEGKLGIGISPAATLDVYGVSGTASINVGTNGTLTSGNSLFTIQSNTYPLVLQSATGNVGVGTTAPGAPLHVLSGDGVARTTQLGLGAFSDQLTAPLYRLQTADLDPVLGEDALTVYTPRYGAQVWFTRGSASGDRSYARIANNSNTDSTLDLYDATAEAGGNLNVRLSTASASWLNGGNVGIGTTAPTAKLDVAGSINVSGRKFASSDGTHNYLLAEPGAHIYFYPNNTASHMMSSNGNFGVGTLNPQVKLQVGDNADTAANFMRVSADNASTNGIGLSLQKSGGTDRFISLGDSGNLLFGANPASFSNTDLASAAQMTITNTGNVGIGTTSPGAKLEVVNPVSAGTGSLQTISRYSQDADQKLVLAVRNTNVNGSAVAPFAGLSAEAWDSVSGAYGRAFFGIRSNASDNSTGQTIISAPKDIGFFINRGTASDNDWSNFGTWGMLINSSGNVGIGTTAPTAKLDVAGEIKATSYTVKQANIPVDGNWYKVAEGSGQWCRIQYRADNGSGNSPGIASGEVYVINDQFAMPMRHKSAQYTVLATNTNVQFARSGNGSQPGAIWVKAHGLSATTFTVLDSKSCTLYLDGTNAASPPAGAGLVIYDQVQQNSDTFFSGGFNPAANVVGALTLEGAYGGGIVFKDTAYAGIWAAENGQTLNLSSNGTSGGFGSGAYGQMVLRGGKLGIGATAPHSKLDVVGDIGAYAAGFTSVVSPVGASLYLADANFNSSGYYNSAPGLSAVYDPDTLVGGSLAFYGYNGLGNSRREHMRISGLTGNVGIGTTAPISALDVVGAGGVSNNYGGYLALNNLTRRYLLGGLSPGDTSFSIADNSAAGTPVRLSIDGPSGNIGIGTTAPQAKLHVVGNLRVDTLNAATATQVCIDGNNVLSSCSSSIRYKDNVEDLHPALQNILKLRPVSYDWLSSKEHDVGFIAEEVEKVDSRLVTYNKDKQIQGVKYDQLTAPIIKAIQELYYKLVGHASRLKKLEEQDAQQARSVASLEAENKALKARADKAEKENAAIKAYICAKDKTAALCR